MIPFATALLLFPGLLWIIGSGVLLAFLAGTAPTRALLSAPWRGLEGVWVSLSILLTAIASACIAWPLNPITVQLPAVAPILAWIGLETAVAILLIPRLATNKPLMIRAAIREAQLGFSGRLVIWFAVAAGLWASQGSHDLPGRLLGLLAGLLVLPVAVGLGPFSPEQSLAPDGTDQSLDEGVFALLRFARFIRATALIGALVAANLPVRILGVPLAVGLTIAILIGFGLALRRSATAPRLTLPAALNWCWWRALPLAVAGLVYLMVI